MRTRSNPLIKPGSVIDITLGILLLLFLLAGVLAPIIFVFANADMSDGMTARERHRAWHLGR